MSFLTVLVSLILGSILFAFLNKIFDVFYFGFKGIFGTWFGCVVVIGVFVSKIFESMGTLFSFIFSLLWLLIKVGLIAFILFTAISLIIQKFGKKEENKGV